MSADGPRSPETVEALRAVMARVDESHRRPRLVDASSADTSAGQDATSPSGRARRAGGVVQSSQVHAPRLRVVPPPPQEAPDADADDRNVIRQIVLKRLAAAPRSRAELETALRRRGCDPRLSAEVLDRFAEVGLIDDRDYATTVARGLRERKGLAGSAIRAELSKRGVDRSIVAEVVADLADDRDEELDRARELALARRSKLPADLPQDAVVRRIGGFLARKGYPPSVCSQAAREVAQGDELS